MDSPAEVFFSPFFKECVGSGNCCQHLDHTYVVYIISVDHIMGLVALFQHGVAVDEEQGWGDWGSLGQPTLVWLGQF